MEVSELLTILREDYLDDTFNGWEDASDAEQADQFLWTDKTLLRYISEAQRQACNRTDFLYDDTSEITQLTLVDGKRDYDVSNLVNVIEDVEYNNLRVKHITKNTRNSTLTDWRTATGMKVGQTSYWMRGRKIFFYPIPNAADAGEIVNLSTYRQPLNPIESSSDSLEIPDEYHRDLIWWVLYEAYSKQDADGYDKQKGRNYLDNFNAAFGPYIDSKVRVHQLENPKVAWFGGIDYINGNNDDDD